MLREKTQFVRKFYSLRDWDLSVGLGEGIIGMMSPGPISVSQSRRR